MYEVFDSYLNVETWHTTHQRDDERFYQALDQVVRRTDFHPDDMAEYFKQKVGTSEDGGGGPFEAAIERREHQASAIADFLKCTGSGG